MNPNAAHFAASPDAWSGLRNVVIPNTKLEDVPGWGNDCSEDNLAAVLRRHGYATGVVRACGFDFAEAIYKENLDAGNSWTTNKDGGAVTHNMEHVTSEAIKFIEQHAGGSNNNNNDDDDDTGDDDDEEEEVKPFFLYFNPTVPHHMADVTDALLFSDCKETVGGRLTTPPVIPYGMTANTNPQRPGCQVYRRSVLERAMAAQTAGNPLYKSGHYFHYSDQELLDKLAGAVWIDDAVGSLLETLEANDLLNNTVVLFQLDHGMETKGSLFEGGSRIAQFAHYPDGFGTQRRQLDKPVATIDIAPTLMDLAGILVTQGAVGDDDGDGDGVQQKHYAVDGKSWANDAKALAGNDDDALSSSPSSAVSALDERCLFVEEGLDRSVRCGCYKYIYVSDTMRGNTVRTAVFIHNPKPETGTILYLAKDHSRVVGMGDNDYHNDYNRVNIHRSHYEKDQLDEHDATDEEKYESSLDYETRTEAPRSTTDEGSVHTASNHSWSSSHCDRSLGTDTDANTSSLLDTTPTNGLEERTPSIGSVESSPSSIWEKLADESKRMAKLREKIHSGDSFREEEHSPEPQQDNNTEGNDHEDDQDRNPSPGPEDIADGTDEASRSGSVSSLSRGSTGSKSSKAGDEDDNNEGTNGGAVAPASGDPKSDGSTSEANADADAEA
eukprot:jgi/Psemu1/291259/fgenesh1_pg.659_\